LEDLLSYNPRAHLNQKSKKFYEDSIKNRANSLVWIENIK
jgi:hypothetical protein